MKTLILCFAGMFLYMQPLFTQIPETIWEKELPVRSSHYFSDVRELPGGNLMLLGAIEQPGDQNFDLWLLELNSSGDTLKTKRFGNPGNDIPIRILPLGEQISLLAFLNETAEKSYKSKLMAVGADFTKQWAIETEYHSSAVNSDIAVDNAGNIWWMNTVPGPEGNLEVSLNILVAKGIVVKTIAFNDTRPAEGFALRALPDGTVAMAYRINPANEKSFVQVVRMNNAGEVMWKTNVPDANKHLTPQCLCCSSDNALLMGGWAGLCYNPDAPAEEQIWDYDYLLSKIDFSGKLLWTQNYNREGSEKGTALAVLPDGKIMAAGKCETSFTGTVGPWLLLVDQNGNKIQDQVYKLKFVKDQVARIICTNDGGILMVGPGYIESRNQLTGWLRKLNVVM